MQNKIDIQFENVNYYHIRDNQNAIFNVAYDQRVLIWDMKINIHNEDSTIIDEINKQNSSFYEKALTYESTNVEYQIIQNDINRFHETHSESEIDIYTIQVNELNYNNVKLDKKNINQFLNLLNIQKKNHYIICYIKNLQYLRKTL